MSYALGKKDVKERQEVSGAPSPAAIYLKLLFAFAGLFVSFCWQFSLRDSSGRVAYQVTFLQNDEFSITERGGVGRGEKDREREKRASERESE